MEITEITEITVQSSDSTHTLKRGASVSQRLRFSQRVHRLIIAPPAGNCLLLEQIYHV